MGKKEEVGVLSKLICKHPNEWDTSNRMDEFDEEVKAIYKKGIDTEQNEEKKKKLKEARDAKMALINDKIKNLCFWDKIKDGEIAKKEEEKKQEKPKQLNMVGPVVLRNLLEPPRMPKTTVTKEKEKPKRTFPSDSSGIYHFHPIAFVEHMKLLVTKEDIDLRPLMTFEPQKERSDCNKTCKRIMKRMGVIAEGATVKAKKYPLKLNNKIRRESYYQLADENEARTELIFRNDSKSEKGYNYIDKSLENGLPVLVGVDHTFNYRSSSDYINETTTDHYVIIVGRKYVNGEQRYLFWDVGTSRGASTEWYFVQQDDKKLIAEKTYKKGNKSYTVTQIRRNENESGQIINY